MRELLLAGAASWAMLIAPQATAAENDEAVASAPVSETGGGQRVEIIVNGRAEKKIGIAGAASEGSVAGADFAFRPLLKPAELLEAVPGMIAAQHSGSGKANQYFLRGFNLDHGSDFAGYIDGVQMNLRTHGHGHGYLDYNGLIPEIVEREDYRKGPYRADGSDFALAGAVHMTTIDGYERPWTAAETGSYGWLRLASGGTMPLGDGRLTLVLQGKTYDGPWQEPEHLRHLSGFAKFATQTGLGKFALTAQTYRATWRPTEQIPDRIIGSALCPDAYCSPDPSATGETTRMIFTAGMTADSGYITLSSQYYNWSMYSNPTYADATGASAQIFQFDRRWLWEAKGEKRSEPASWLKLRLGSENRFDDIGRTGVAQSDARTITASLGAYRVREASASLYGEAEVKPLPGVRVIAGARGDLYDARVIALDPEAAALGEGHASASLLSPKLALAWNPLENLEFYANWGRGFHSNDARGAVNVANPVPLLVRGTGKEVGARFQHGAWNLTATYWWLDLGSELRFVGDSNAVEPSGASRRRGVELVGFWRPFPWLAIDANYTASHARYADGQYIPNAFENAAAVGVTLSASHFDASIRLRHLGPYPLVEDNSLRDKGSNVVNARGGWKTGRFEVYAELLNMLGSKDKDIAYYYESYIPGFDSAPVEGRLGREVEPRTLRAGVKFYW